MKKALLLSLLILFSNSSYSQAVAVDGVGVLTEKPTNPGAVGRVLGWGIKKVFTTPIKISGKVVGTCLLSKKACAGIAAGSLGFAYLYDHPEAVEHYLEIHPDKYDELQKYLEYRKTQTTDVDKIEKYDQAIEDTGINARTITEQLDIEENNSDFKDILQQLTKIALSIDNASEMDNYTKNSCSIEVAKTLVELKPAEFNSMINVYLPKKNIGSEILFSFDKYGNLKSKRNIMEADHIPSYKALEWFFINNGVSFQGKAKSKNKYSNLLSNATAIIIPYDTHKKNRTNGPKNEILSTRDGLNSTTLRNSFLKDFTMLLWIEKGNSINFNELVNILPQVYIRNKMLCLYDLDNKNQGQNLQQIKDNLNNFDYQTLLNQIEIKG